MGINGSLDNDKIVLALLQQRNTPDNVCKLSPAEILFGRSLLDELPKLDKSVRIHDSGQLHSQWHEAWRSKEEAIKTRIVSSCEKLDKSSWKLPPFREGDNVWIQNQGKDARRSTKWDRQGTRQ